MSKVLYHHKWMDLLANDQDEAFIKMEDAVIMIPVIGDEVVMIEEQSIAYGDTMLVLPTGGIEAGENALAAAGRELEEEIGYKAKQLEVVGLLHPSLKYADWRCWVCLAQDLTPHKRTGDERTPVVSQFVKFDMIDTLISKGVVKDSTVIAAFHIAGKYMR